MYALIQSIVIHVKLEKPRVIELPMILYQIPSLFGLTQVVNGCVISSMYLAIHCIQLDKKMS